MRWSNLYWPPYLRDRDPAPPDGVVAALEVFDPALTLRFNSLDKEWQYWKIGVHAGPSPATITVAFGVEAGCVLRLGHIKGVPRRPTYEDIRRLREAKLAYIAARDAREAAIKYGKADILAKRAKKKAVQKQFHDDAEALALDHKTQMFKAYQDARPANFSPPEGP